MAMYQSVTLDYVTYSKHTDWYICHPIMIISSLMPTLLLAGEHYLAYSIQSHRNQVSVLKPPNKADLRSSERAGVLNIFTNHLVRNLVHKHKTINLTR